jgi:NADH:ubiquinone oxidoreductase subunit F (NADH-binding)
MKRLQDLCDRFTVEIYWKAASKAYTVYIDGEYCTSNKSLESAIDEAWRIRCEATR